MINKLIILITVGLFNLSCESILSSNETGEALRDNLVYMTSFETNESLNDWEGAAYAIFRADTPPGGKERSLFVAGGCGGTRMRLILLGAGGNHNYTIRFWAKVLSADGGVSLVTYTDEGKPIELVKQYNANLGWTEYEAHSNVAVSDGLRMAFSCCSGGLEPGAMLVDLLEIRKTE